MRILFDNGTPNPIARSLPGHDVVFARKVGWYELKNGDLLREAEASGFDLLLTTDRNIRYQQNLANRKIAIVVLSTQQWPDVQRHLTRITEAINSATPGSFTEVEIPFADS